MKQSLLSLLACPRCGGEFNLISDAVDGPEIMEGTLSCTGCSGSVPVVRGVPRFVASGLSAEKQATAAAFAYEWTHYSTLTEADKREFLGWIAPLTPADFAEQVVLDGGCGKGRHIYLASRFGARTVVGIDLSEAVDAAFENTRQMPNVHVVQADILDLPFRNPFTLAYSIGVLHHLPVPGEGFLALTRHLRPGGRISTWVYGKEGNRWIEILVNPVRKNVTSRLPGAITRCLCLPPAVLLFLGLRLLYAPARSRPWLKHLLPYAEYLCSISGYSFAENFWNVFDQLAAPTAFYHSRGEVEEWFRAAGVEETVIERHNGNSWRGTGLISPARGSKEELSSALAAGGRPSGATSRSR